ncbi:MAG: hypothetical protein L0H53_10995 [Candidatus Nitrosocosmicus sp.]|nr:hypothetical protein [Candidatus Nitrosocosmicus sp.]MDN5868627.1 hypothetical protein [Candidatus Nitrosocosmicus sp.]
MTKELLDDDQSINPTRYKILIRIGDEELYLPGWSCREYLFQTKYDAL